MCADKTQPPATTFSRRFGSWNEALKRAGLEIKEYRKPKTYSNAEMILAIKELASELGRPPLVSDIRWKAQQGMIPCPETYKSRFGTWDKALEAAMLKETKPRNWWQRMFLFAGEWCLKKSGNL